MKMVLYWNDSETGTAPRRPLRPMDAQDRGRARPDDPRRDGVRLRFSLRPVRASDPPRAVVPGRHPRRRGGLRGGDPGPPLRGVALDPQGPRPAQKLSVFSSVSVRNFSEESAMPRVLQNSERRL